MADRKYEKFIVYAGTTDPPVKHPPGSTPGTEMFYINDKVIKGAFTLCGTWLNGVPQMKPEMMKQHVHDSDEYIGFLGCDPHNPKRLGAEVEFWYEDEKYIIKDSCILFVPKYIRHAPMVYLKVDSPFFIFSVLPDPLHGTHELDTSTWKGA
jgi:hypothetical protein